MTNDAFMEQVIQQGEVIFDYALLESSTAPFPHVLQDMAFDAALKDSGFGRNGRVPQVARRCPQGQGSAAHHLRYRLEGLRGSELWLTTFDVLAGEGIAPEDLTPALLKVLGLGRGPVAAMHLPDRITNARPTRSLPRRSGRSHADPCQR